MTDDRPLMLKFCFQHLSNDKTYVVGAFSRDEAVELVADITGDYHFVDAELPEGHR